MWIQVMGLLQSIALPHMMSFNGPQFSVALPLRTVARTSGYILVPVLWGCGETCPASGIMERSLKAAFVYRP